MATLSRSPATRAARLPPPETGVPPASNLFGNEHPTSPLPLTRFDRAPLAAPASASICASSARVQRICDGSPAVPGPSLSRPVLGGGAGGNRPRSRREPPHRPLTLIPLMGIVVFIVPGGGRSSSCAGASGARRGTHGAPHQATAERRWMGGGSVTGTERTDTDLRPEGSAAPCPPVPGTANAAAPGTTGLPPTDSSSPPCGWCASPCPISALIAGRPPGEGRRALVLHVRR